MAVLKKILGYEICLWEIEGNKFRGDKILLIRNGFTELVSFETEQVTHEMGDKITDKRVREAIMGWIADNRIDLIKECEKANRLNYNPKQFS